LWALRGDLTFREEASVRGEARFPEELRGLGRRSVPLKLSAIRDAPGLTLTAVTAVIGVN